MDEHAALQEQHVCLPKKKTKDPKQMLRYNDLDITVY